MSMFKKKDKVTLDQQAISTFIGEGCFLEGNLKAPAFVRIDGQVTGNVTIEGGLILGERGIINGDVTTHDMVVYGTIKGDIDTHSLEIRGTGNITGELKTQTLLVEAGAIYNGVLSMAQNTKVATE
ncbi:cytoskeletal protein CcmA (bactofilin family) [Mucilaginibacter gracilis]|uniref:Cytoskeletal protein CcmA (Bactofilin family) n=1 Tax=Mucilaginibacter gracilis TaxID=423350 RepID=A0A495JA92_9SPHI|nr:polymer-forming cytoskeletal protein [Mucilaginibacter gracilis]RKR85398.1 cytoskeletal protein CcmA (bactofilin family) [Mucilaginibacter gracilis]